MTGRITLLCHGRTTARPSGFPGDEPLAAGEIDRIAALAPTFTDVIRVLSSPASQAQQTAGALSSEVAIDSRLEAIGLGRWRGRTIAEIEASEPEALAAWIADPDFAGHGGEIRTAHMRRVAAWLREARTLDGHVLAVTHASFIQTAMLSILDAPATAFRNIDVAPLHALDLRRDRRRWTIRSFSRL